MTVERAMKRVVHHLTHLSRVWKVHTNSWTGRRISRRVAANRPDALWLQDVLPRHVYLRTVGLLLDTVLEDLITSFEQLVDISEEETHHLHELLSLLLDCSTFFAPTDGEDEGSEKGKQQQHALAESGQEEETKRYARRWSKFVKIVNILESKLVVIVDAYVKGIHSRNRHHDHATSVLASSHVVRVASGLMPEFEAEELKNIIRALFSDSPLRKSQLALIK
jgi:hypothetical protein